ncbi:MAG: protein kinase [bacterium]
MVCSDYEIVRLVAAGADGEIYETKHQLTGQPAMIKAMPAPFGGDPQSTERIMSEARAVAKLDHPNLLTLYNFRKEGSRFLAVLQIPGGQPLEGLVQSESQLDLDRFKNIFEQILDALSYAHNAGLPHGRLTALSVAVDAGDRVKVTGFDRFVRLENEGAKGLASIRYLAPEQIRKHLADERTDLYAVGIMAYFALTGQVPYDGDAEFDVMRAHLEDPPRDIRELRPDIPEALWAVIKTALAKDQSKRHQSAHVMLAALRAGLLEAATAPAIDQLASAETTVSPSPAVAGSVSGAARARIAEPTPAEPAPPPAERRRAVETQELFPTKRAAPEPALAAPEPEPTPAPKAAPEALRAAPEEPEAAPASDAAATLVTVAPVTPSGTLLGAVQTVKKAVPRSAVVDGVVREETPQPPAAAAESRVSVPPLTAPKPAQAMHEPAVPQLPDEPRAPAPPGPMTAPAVRPAPPPSAPSPPPASSGPSPTAPSPPPSAASWPSSAPPTEVDVTERMNAPEFAAHEEAPKVVVTPAPEPAPALEPAAPEAAAKEARKADVAPAPEPAQDSAAAQKPAPAGGLEPSGRMRQLSGEELLKTTPYRGLKIQDGGETEFFSVEQEFDDTHDDFSDLDDFQPKAARRRKLLVGLIVLVLAAAGGVYWGVGKFNPYSKGGDTQGQKRPENFDRVLLAQVYKEDPVLSGEPLKVAAHTPKPGMRVVGMRPTAMTPDAMTPAAMTPAAMTPDAMTPDAMTPAAMTPDAMTPAVMTPDPVTPAAGGGEASRLAAEAQKNQRSNVGKAETLAEQALKLDPAEPVARKVLAGILEGKAKQALHSGANGKAVSTASRATQLDPSRANPWFYLGVASNELGKKAVAKAALAQYLSLCAKCGYNTSYAKQILKSIK